MKKASISIKGAPALLGLEEAEGYELMTEGEYQREGRYSKFSYVESELTGYNGLLTTFYVEPDKVIVSRSDGYTGDMIFSENQKQNFLYETSNGSVMMGIDTLSIKRNLRDDGGSLEIRYDIEVDHVSVSRNLFKIKIKTYPQ